MRAIIAAVVILFASKSYGQIITVNENLSTSSSTLLVDTNNNRLDVGTNSYTGGATGVVAFIGSNTVVGTGTGASNQIVLYSTGSIDVVGTSKFGGVISSGAVGPMTDYRPSDVAQFNGVSPVVSVINRSSNQNDEAAYLGAALDSGGVVRKGFSISHHWTSNVFPTMSGRVRMNVTSLANQDNIVESWNGDPGVAFFQDIGPGVFGASTVYVSSGGIFIDGNFPTPFRVGQSSLTMTRDGNIGINVQSGGAKLAIKSDPGFQRIVRQFSSGGAEINTTWEDVSGNGYQTVAALNGDVKVQIHSAANSFINSGFNVGIDTGIPQSTLDVNGTVTSTSSVVSGKFFNGYEIISNNCGAGVADCFATCSSGKQIVGGGCNTAGGTLTYGFPNTTSKNIYDCGTLVATTIVAYAICMRTF